MRKTIGMLLLMIGTAAIAAAVPSVPEVDPASAGSLIAVVTGGLLVLGSRRKK